MVAFSSINIYRLQGDCFAEFILSLSKCSQRHFLSYVFLPSQIAITFLGYSSLSSRAVSMLKYSLSVLETMTTSSSTDRKKQTPRRVLSLMVLGFLLFLMPGLLLTTNASASPDHQTDATPTVSPAPTPTFDLKRLDKPVVPEVLAQVDEGAIVYWGICMACHGDRGQGLTDEWRYGAFAEDGDCWQSGCHGKDHPPSGFEIPKTLIIPPLGTVGAMGRFENAQQLYDYVVVMMPWWKPNSLGEVKAWQVTAYLLKLRGSLPEGITLDVNNASAVPVHRNVTAPGNQHSAIYFFLGTLFLGMIGFIARDFLTRR
jgi:hypothetical protein